MTTITIKCCFDSKFCARKTSLWYFTRSLSLCPHLASRSYRCARIRALPHCQFIGICRHQSKTTTTMDNDDNHKTTSILLSTSVECTWSNNTHHPHFLWKFCVFTAVLFQLRLLLLLLSLPLLIAHNIQMESILVWACVCVCLGTQQKCTFAITCISSSSFAVAAAAVVVVVVYFKYMTQMLALIIFCYIWQLFSLSSATSHSMC